MTPSLTHYVVVAQDILPRYNALGTGRLEDITNVAVATAIAQRLGHDSYEALLAIGQAVMYKGVEGSSRFVQLAHLGDELAINTDLIAITAKGDIAATVKVTQRTDPEQVIYVRNHGLHVVVQDGRRVSLPTNLLGGG